MKDFPLKIILAVLLIACLIDFPYGYYQFVRFIALMFFAYFAYNCFKLNNEGKAFLYIALALLFQPFFKIYLGRTLWNMVDIIVSTGLFVDVFYSVKNKKNE